jgi:adhesin transport system membrane fusion protein
VEEQILSLQIVIKGKPNAMKFFCTFARLHTLLPPLNPTLSRERNHQKFKDIRRQFQLADQRIARLKAKRRQYLDEIAQLKEHTKAYAFLDRSGAIPHNDVLEAKRRIAPTETHFAELDGNIKQAGIEGNELRVKLQRLQVRSPVNGIVKNFFLKTVGGVISPGSVVVEVVKSAND